MTRLPNNINNIISCRNIMQALSIFILLLAPAESIAQSQYCNTGNQYQPSTNLKIFATVSGNIKCILFGKAADPQCVSQNSVASILFNTLLGDNGFTQAIRAVAVLFVVIYAMFFMIGIVQLSMRDFVDRMFKFGLIAILLSSNAWLYFYNTIGLFFQNGTDWLIAISTNIALGTVPGLNTNDPFALIDYTIATAISPKMLVAVMATFYTGPYGILLGVLTIMGLGSFVTALFQMTWIYLMSMIIRAFLFGIAPIFIPLFMFQKTRYLFDGWLNQLVNSMLQPVLLLMFFAFFCTLVQSSMNNILRIPVCYVELEKQHGGAPNAYTIPRYQENGVPADAKWGFKGVNGNPVKAFPIDIMDIITFLLLAQLAWRFNYVAINIARELSGAVFDINVQGAFSNMLSPSKAFNRAALSGSENALQHLQSRGVTMRQGARNAMTQGVLGQSRQRAQQLLNRQNANQNNRGGGGNANNP